jgi:hypothetical protein
MIRDVFPGSQSGFFPIPDPGPELKKKTGSRIQDTDTQYYSQGV